MCTSFHTAILAQQLVHQLSYSCDIHTLFSCFCAVTTDMFTTYACMFVACISINWIEIELNWMMIWKFSEGLCAFLFCCRFFYIRDVSFVCLYVLHMQLSCCIKSILTYLLTYVLRSYCVVCWLSHCLVSCHTHITFKLQVTQVVMVTERL